MKKRNLSFWVICTVTCCQTISKSKHLVHIYYNTWSYAVYKGSNQTTTETNTLTYYIVANKKDNVADSGIIPCGIGDHDLVYVIRHARLPTGFLLGIFFRGGKIYCYANFYCYSIVFGPNVREG